MILKISKMYVDGKEDREDLFPKKSFYQLWKSYQNFEGKSQFLHGFIQRKSINTAPYFS